MTPTPPSSTTSPNVALGSVGGPPNNDNYRVVRKRNRIPLSCAPCRGRKLKCNRSLPCENCSKRGEAATCSYAAPASRRKGNTRVEGGGAPDDMQNRIDRLENLVLSLMGGQGSPAAAPNQALGMDMQSQPGQEYTPPNMGDSFHKEGAGEEEVDSETDKVANSFGILHFQNNKAMYIGDAHWAAILNDISEVKSYFNEHKKQYDDQMRKINDVKANTGRALDGAPAFLLGGGQNLPLLPELLNSLPGRDAVDRLVFRYFNDYDATTHILHPPSWRRSYEAHWQNPGQTEPAFLGQLFAICGLAMQSYNKIGDEPQEYQHRSLGLAANYRRLTQQCLMLADYTKPSSVILETMVLHLHGEFSKNGEAEVGIWILGGMIVRLAMRMGLHRDSKHYSNITPFQGEMRRRIWTYIRMIDITFSFQMGLPAMIRSEDCDTELPRNLTDEDFDEADTALPPSRPTTEWTQILYMISKAQIACVFGKIVEATHIIHTAPYEEISALDSELRDAYHALPSILHPKTTEEISLEPIHTTVMRLHVTTTFHKAVCVLHRRYLTRARENQKYAHSRRACIDSSMDLLRAQVVLHNESRPGRRLQNCKWYTNSITLFDFLLPATLVCLDLFYSASEESRGHSSGDVDMWGSCRREEMIDAIKTSRSIWEELKDSYMEAFKACSILGIMLQKVQNMRAQTAARLAQRVGDFAGGSKPAQQYSPAEDEKPEHSAAITLGMLSSGGPGPAAFSGGVYPPTPGSSNNTSMPDAPSTGMTPDVANNQFAADSPGAFAFFNDGGVSMDQSAVLDWAAWDSYIQSSAQDLAAAAAASAAAAPATSWNGVDMGVDSHEQLQQAQHENPQQQQQLNSNMFANPNMFPPGTTLG